MKITPQLITLLATVGALTFIGSVVGFAKLIVWWSDRGEVKRQESLKRTITSRPWWYEDEAEQRLRRSEPRD